MLGLLYLFLTITTGWAVSSLVFPELDKYTQSAFDRRNIRFSPYILKLPVWFITGTLLLTWAVYLIASLAAKSASPLMLANMLVLPAALIFSALTFYLRHIKQRLREPMLCQDKNTLRTEAYLLAGITILAAVLMYSTFYEKNGQLHIGVSVFSDFSPHIGMIRSFSKGNNFPTAYSHYGGADIKYHFMFQFLVGNLEFLGMRLDHAFNLPSILSFVSAFLLLYLLAVKITGMNRAGLLACLFFAFRSSKTLFTYLARLPDGTNMMKHLSENTAFLGDTPHEDWGLWNLNVYCNQRHFAFGLAVLFFILLLFLPHLYGMFEAVKRQGSHSFKLVFLTGEGWRIQSYRLPVAAGILLGSLSFFHGAAVIGCLILLFFIALVSEKRLEFLITAVITVLLSLLQTGFFIDGSAVTVKYLFGFIADNKTIFGVASYLERLLGILPYVLVGAFCISKVREKYLMLAFTAPLIFAFTVSLTVDVTVNHKYVMMSCILLGIFAASFLDRLLARRDIMVRITAIILILLLTAAGIYDFTTVLRKNRREGYIVLELKDELTDFVIDYSDSGDLFLTAPYTVNQVVLGGAMLYQGHQYYAWSAGYDTYYRDEMVKRMYEADTPDKLDDLVRENGIRFIIVDHDNRISTDYRLEEENIRNTYGCVYERGEEEWKLSIFDTRLLLSD